MLKTKVIKKYPNFTLLAVYKVNNDKEEYLYNTCKNISEKTASIRSYKKYLKNYKKYRQRKKYCLVFKNKVKTVVIHVQYNIVHILH